MWKPVFRNTETVLIGLMDIYRVQLICQAQSRFAVRSRLYDWVETDKLVLLQSHTFLGSIMPDSMDMVAGIFTSPHDADPGWYQVWSQIAHWENGAKIQTYLSSAIDDHSRYGTFNACYFYNGSQYIAKQMQKSIFIHEDFLM